MSRERLNRLIELLQTHKWTDMRYDLREWETTDSYCPVGLAMHDPWFQERGLMPYPGLEVENPVRWPVMMNNGESLVGTRAAAKFFGLPIKVVEWLFSPWAYDEGDWFNPQAVINRLTYLLAGQPVIINDDGDEYRLLGGAP